MKTLDLSIILVSYNTRELLRDCIMSIYETVKQVDFEVFVVDNASSDGSPGMVAEEFHGVGLIENTENVGFARAVNQGMIISRGRYVLLLNSDTVLKEGTVNVLMDFLDRRKNAAAAGPKVLSTDGETQNKGFLFPSVIFSFLILSGINKLGPERFKRRLFPRFFWDENTLKEVDYLEGSCFLIRKEAIDAVGLLPEEYFMYFEEAEWCFRAKQLGYEIWYVPEVEVTHLVASSPSGNRDDVYNKSMILFYKRNVGAVRGTCISLIMILATAIDFFSSWLFGRSNADRKKVLDRMKQHVAILREVLA